MSEQLGRVRDGLLARCLGISHQAVSSYRRSRGIPALASPYRTIVAELEHDDRLGTMTDVQLAGVLGVPRKVVQEARNRRGIPPHRRGRQAQCGTRYSYNQGCRCTACRQASTRSALEYLRRADPALQKARVARARAKVLASAPHATGKIAWYVLGCRCDGCGIASRAYQRGRYLASRQSVETAA